MRTPERTLLEAEVEIDEFFLGGYEEGLKGGRQRGKKTLCGVAIEVRGRGSGGYGWRCSPTPRDRRCSRLPKRTLLGLGRQHDPITYRDIIEASGGRAERALLR